MSDQSLLQAIRWPTAGRYIIAVSGGVDSMTLLDIFAKTHRDYELIVAHVNHGLRPDAAADQDLVRQTAAGLGLKFITTNLELADRSEATARRARYEFLLGAKLKHEALGIITAHTRDDQLETIIFASLRTSGGRGLAGMAAQPPLLRPLLGLSKAELITYAGRHHLAWREDSTNVDTTYARNYLRHQFIPGLVGQDDQLGDSILADAATLAAVQQQLTTEIETWLTDNAEPAPSAVKINKAALRAEYISVGAAIIGQVAIGLQPDIELSAERLSEAARFAKTARRGQIDLGTGLVLSITSQSIVLLIAGRQPTG